MRAPNTRGYADTRNIVKAARKEREDIEVGRRIRQQNAGRGADKE